MNNEIKNLIDFKCWVKTQLIMRKTSQKALARKMNVTYSRISEAINGKPSGKKYVKPLIKELGGDIENFKNII